jgi:hypothetical protein
MMESRLEDADDVRPAADLLVEALHCPALAGEGGEVAVITVAVSR